MTTDTRGQRVWTLNGTTYNEAELVGLLVEIPGRVSQYFTVEGANEYGFTTRQAPGVMLFWSDEGKRWSWAAGK